MTAPRAPAPSGEAGFTLIEVLVSLVILVVILSFIPGTLRIGQRVWQLDDTYERRAALDNFRRYAEQRLTEAMAIHIRDRTGRVRLEFTGDPARVVFVAPAAAGPGGGGVYRFELSLAGGDARYRPLALKQTLYRTTPLGLAPEEAPAPAAMEHLSQASVAGLSFRYFGAPARGSQPQWQTQWPGDTLPELVEIAITIGGGQVERSVVPLRLRAGS
jgi:prepilin-type N-terminal cleavage/methylation domain-containing protein